MARPPVLILGATSAIAKGCAHSFARRGYPLYLAGRDEREVSGRNMSNRCYLRGTSLLGLFNTVVGCLFNRVLVIAKDSDTGKVVRRYWDRADRHPAAEGA